MTQAKSYEKLFEKTLSSKSLIDHWEEQQADRLSHPELYKLRSTGLASLDAALDGGVEFGQFVLYGGAQKIGKSTLLQCTAQSFGKHGDPFIYLSAEMSTMSMGTRVLCSLAGIEKRKVRQMTLDEVDWIQLREKEKDVREWRAWWNYGFSTIDDITALINQIKSDYRIDIQTIFVDYVQLMEYPGKLSRQEQLASISRAFKRLSVELRKPLLIFAAVQTNRESIRSHIIDANAFMGTGAFERDMDIGVIISDAIDEETKKPKDNERLLTVVGSRDTGTGKPCTVWFNGALGQIKDKLDAMPAKSINYWAT